MNTVDSSVGTQLPVHEVDIRFVFSVACYPYVILLLYVGGGRQMAVYETLAHIEYRSYSASLLHNPQPCSHAVEQLLLSASLAYLCVGGFKVKYRWQVAPCISAVFEEILSLTGARREYGEEVVGTGAVAVLACGGIVGRKVSALYGCALGGFYVNERHGVVDGSFDGLLGNGAQRCNSEVAPVYGIALAAVLMLET